MIVEKSKIEVEAYINDRVMRAGMASLNNENQPIKMIENTKGTKEGTTTLNQQ